MLHERVSPETLGCARIWVFGIWLGWVLLDPLPDLARYPAAELLRPIGVLRVIPSSGWPFLLSPAGLWGLKLALLAGLAALVLGLPRYRPVAIVTCVLLTFYQGLVRGLTFSNHGQLALLYATWVLAVFPAADAMALRRRPALAPPVMYSAPMQLIALVLLTSYSLVGVRRLMESAPGIFIDGTIIHYVALRAAPARSIFGDTGLAVLEYPWLAFLLEVGFPVVGAFEVLAPLCLFSRWFRRAWIPAVVGFHVGTWVLMGILFLFNLLMIPMFVTEADRVLAPRRAPSRKAS